MAKFKKPQWISQVRDTYRLTVPVDPAIRWILPVTFIATTGILAAIGVSVGGLALSLAVTSWAWGILVTVFVFGRRAEKAAFTQVEGKPGVSAQVVKSKLRTGWFVTDHPIEINRSQEIVFRVVGRAGVIHLIEAPAGAAIAGVARSKAARWVGEVPITDVFVGNGEGQVRLLQLSKTLKKLPKVLRPAEVTELRRKLEAAAPGVSMPIPKGPMPKGMRVPRR